MGGGLFFPRSNTTHCQLQARRFQALLPEFEHLHARLLGISSDTVAQQVTFREICRLQFPLFTDSTQQLIELFGVREDDLIDGESTHRAKRQTFLISPEGVIAHHWVQVDPNTHASEVLEYLRAHSSARRPDLLG